MRRYSTLLIAVVVLGAIGLFGGCSSSDDESQHTTSSRSYQGHATDIDSNNLVAAFPATFGTRLDDCHTCHKSGVVTFAEGGKTATLNQCSYCHAKVFDAAIYTDEPQTYAQTLNSFGAAYLAAGKNKDALKTIAAQDSDSDGYTNAQEIAALTYPGDAKSNPGQAEAPIIELDWAKITGMPVHSQFMLMNASKQSNDEYVLYEGVKIKDLLEQAGVDLTGAEGITLLAPDGYTMDFTMEQVNKNYPNQVFYSGLDKGGAKLGDKGFVYYTPENLWPAGVSDQGVIPGVHWLLLAYKRDNGEFLDKGYLDTASGKIGGEGPFRGIIPQANPGRPDRGRNDTPVNDGWDYGDDLDHNAGSCPKVVVAIRINPMPEGKNEFDWRSYGGWALVDGKKLLIYGHGVTGK